MELQQISCHNVNNAFEDIMFCDPLCGLFGAICADILHCLQHGLFQYALQMLFNHKKVRNKNSTSNNDNNEFSSRCVFTPTYSKRFEGLTLQYGKLLMHQSDRDLPRTHFNTNYLTTTRKNAHEMSGILIVILCIFNTNEGTNQLDSNMAEIQSTKYIHILELLLLLETFCQTKKHKKSDVIKFKEFMPYFLNTYKTTLNRQEGCEMKLIKFHLPLHFADDILRFGSMSNFDTGVGESHHKTEAKKPSKNTQKRRGEFEIQTATRQIENLSINRGISIVVSNELLNTDTEVNLFKWYRYTYSTENGLCYYKKNAKKNKKIKCSWIDKQFQMQLNNVCQQIIASNLITGELHFFSQHNRQQSIFRADPNYTLDKPWYDWVEVQWNEGVIPAKLLLFWDLKEDQLKGNIYVGNAHISNIGKYAIAYSISSTDSIIPAHNVSKLVQWGSLELDPNDSLVPRLYIFPVESILGPISAIPYKTEDNIISAIEWIFLRPKNEWYGIFIALINSTLK